MDAGQGRAFDLDDRLLEFAAAVIRLTEKMSRSPAGLHVANQVIRSGTSPLFNHGEAESAESPKDFIHKLRICLRELRETKRALRLIARVPLIRDPSWVRPVYEECDELVRIFFASIRTARARAGTDTSDDT